MNDTEKTTNSPRFTGFPPPLPPTPSFCLQDANAHEATRAIEAYCHATKAYIDYLERSERRRLASPNSSSKQCQATSCTALDIAMIIAMVGCFLLVIIDELKKDTCPHGTP